MSHAMSPLFKRYISGFTIGELPKPTTVALTPERYRELGYVQLPSGEWVHTSEAAMLPQGGKLVWVRM